MISFHEIFSKMVIRFDNFLSREIFAKWPFTKVYLAKLQKFRLKPRESLSRESFPD